MSGAGLDVPRAFVAAGLLGLVLTAAVATRAGPGPGRTTLGECTVSKASKPAKFDGRVLPEALPQQDPREKTAATVKDPQADAADRAHAAARKQDAAIEVQRHLTRATRDRDRTYPRAGDLGQPTKPVRPRPNGQPPTTPSTYQMRQRAQTKRTAQSRLPQTEYRALSALVTDEQHWLKLNAELTAAHCRRGNAEPGGPGLRTAGRPRHPPLRAGQRPRPRRLRPPSPSPTSMS